MLSAARRFARRPDHATVDSCVVIVLTHGEYDGLIGVDGHVINTHDFLACFNSRAAPNLSGKPKLFFIQACRGQNHDVGIPHQIPVDEWDARGSAADQQPSGSLSAFFSKMFGSTGGSPTRKPSKSRPSLPQGPPVNLSTVASVRFGSPALPAFDPNRFRLVLQPSEADFLIAYATVPRYVSWRNSVYGSWFVQAICEVFGKHAATDDLLTLLTKASPFLSSSGFNGVNKRVCKFESSDVNRSKQIPEFSVRLQRTFYFFPGITSEE
ncbi:Caspase domain protein [Aphelenchoides fujianensis]|nr:Caspase domain protein [Aphelenchoides fujianensis]